MLRGRSNSVLPRPEDLREAIEFICDSYECWIDPTTIRLVALRELPPIVFVDDGAHLGRRPAGWLRPYPESQWAEELRGAYSRTFDHIIEYHRRGQMPPGIQIDGLMGDGRGRAQFHYAIGAPTMSVAIYETGRHVGRR